MKTKPCRHGVARRCRECRREYHRNYARTVRRVTCPLGHAYTDTGAGRDGRLLRRCFICCPAPAPKPPRPVRTHCPNGHERTPENYRPYGSTYPRCVPCAKGYHQAWRKANPDKEREINRRAQRRYQSKFRKDGAR